MLMGVAQEMPAHSRVLATPQGIRAFVDVGDEGLGTSCHAAVGRTMRTVESAGHRLSKMTGTIHAT